MDNYKFTTAKANVNETGIGSYHLADTPDLYEPARNHAFQFVLNEDLNTLLAAGVIGDTATDDDYFKKSDEVISISVDEASVPHFEVEVLSLKRGNSTMKFAGAPTWGEGSLKLSDFVGARTKDVLMAWQALVYDLTSDVVHLAGNYKRDCTLIEYNGDYSEVIRRWTLKGCWVRSISEGNFTHNDNGLRSLDAIIVYDRAIPQIEKTEAATE